MAYKRIYEGDFLEEAANACAAYAENYIANKYGTEQQKQDFTGTSLQKDSSSQVITSSEDMK